MIKVLIVDDHALVRLGIRSILQNVEDIEVIGEASSGEDSLEQVRHNMPDVILLDVKMPGIGGIEATKRLLRINPELKIIAVTAIHEDPFPSRLMQAGAFGYLTKECGKDEMVAAIRRVNQGKKYIIPEVAQQLALRNLSDEKTEVSPLENLSERELQVMLMITSGLKVPEIADKLCLSTKTVNSYRYRLFEKFNIRNDVELTLVAVRHGLLDRSELAADDDDQ